MRDYSNFDNHLNGLLSDVYGQPEDGGHTDYAMHLCFWAQDALRGSVLDVGCGNGFCQSFIKNYTGVGFGVDIEDGKRLGRNISEMDFNFLQFPDDSFDTVFSRHSLEHSPFPILTLMEWHRVGKRFLVLCLPNPEYYTFTGRNHYSVSNPPQLAWWLRRAGWKIGKARKLPTELWFLCSRMRLIGYEGWATAPLRGEIYEFERDLFLNSNFADGKVLDGIL